MHWCYQTKFWEVALSWINWYQNFVLIFFSFPAKKNLHRWNNPIFTQFFCCREEELYEYKSFGTNWIEIKLPSWAMIRSFPSIKLITYFSWHINKNVMIWLKKSVFGTWSSLVSSKLAGMAQHSTIDKIMIRNNQRFFPTLVQAIASVLLHVQSIIIMLQKRNHQILEFFLIYETVASNIMHISNYVFELLLQVIMFYITILQMCCKSLHYKNCTPNSSKSLRMS